MSNPTTPPKGQMQLFDYLTVPLDPGSYRLHVESQVTHDPGQTTTMTNDGYFDVVGPRFSLSPRLTKSRSTRACSKVPGLETCRL